MTEIEDLEAEIEELEAEIERLENNENEEEYDDFLDELGDVKIGNMSYLASRVLKEVDPIAYRCGHSDYNDSRLSELYDELEEKKEELEELKKDLKK